MQFYKLISLFPSVFHITRKNKNKPFFSKTISSWLSFLTFVFNLHLLRYSFGTSRSWLGLWRHCWQGQLLWPVQNADWEWNLHAEFPPRFMSYFVIFLKLFHIPCYKRDSKCVLWHCSDQKHFGLWHAYVPVFVYGSCKVSYQGTTLRASDLHNALAPILNPVNRFDYAQYISYTSWS